jgi:prepilin-type processing-associated H-X9-DG protein/prepilin-type N-terminal cleavage/methylation domain-containing protein
MKAISQKVKRGVDSSFHLKTLLQQNFSLIELLVVIAILAVLFSLLQPALKGMVEKHHDVSCRNNLNQLGSLSIIFSNDHDDNIPGNGFSYNDPQTPTWWPSAWGTYTPYTKERYLNAADHLWWYSKGNLGQYVFEGKDVTDYQNHEFYDCATASIRTLPTGEEAPVIQSYWVNVNHHDGKKAPWASNSGISDKNPISYTRFTEIMHPSMLMSIADTAQNLNGTVDAPGAFNLIPHYYDDEHAPWPNPGPNPWNPDAQIGPLVPGAQNGRASRRGILDFRHKQGVNAVFFDGHVENLINGTLYNKNLYRP